MNLYADSRLLDEAFMKLAGWDTDTRVNAAKTIKQHVELAARELSLERFAKFENELYNNILSYVHGNVLNEKIGGILALRELIDCTSAAAEAKIRKFAKALAISLGSSTDFSLIELIADALGHMASNSPIAHVDYLESELIRALDWLKGKNTLHRRFAACTILQQLARNAPTIFFVRINEFFDLIWGPLWDSKEKIRFAASNALSACLAVLRERTYHLQWYCYLYDQFQEGFLNGSEEYVHGSLLAVNDALRFTGSFMIPRFREVCRSVMTFKDHRSRVVRSAIIQLLPSLAKLCPDAFARAHLNESVAFLVKCSKSADLRPQALLSTGKLSQAVGQHLVSRIDDLMTIVKESFTPVGGKKSKTIEVTPECLACISDMVQGLGSPFHERVLTLLEPMLNSGLTPELINTLRVICHYIPNQRTMIETRLLEEATKILGGDSKPVICEPDYLYSWARKGVRYASTHEKTMLTNEPKLVTNGVYATRSNAAQAVRQSGSTVNLIQAPYRPLSTRKAGATTALMMMGQQTGRSNSPPASPNRPPPITPSQSTSSLVGSSIAGGLKKHLSFMNFGRPSSPPVPVPAASDASVAGHGGYATGKVPPELILLALRTLAALSIPNSSLMPLVQQSVLPYLVSEDYRVRTETAITCSKLIISSLYTDPQRREQTSTSAITNSVASRNGSGSDTLSCFRPSSTTSRNGLIDAHLQYYEPVEMSAHLFVTRGPTAAAIEEVISRLLEVVVSDFSHVVRLYVLQHLTAPFDVHLARAHHIDTILLLLADEHFEIRLEALSLLGRLGVHNPAAILPQMRMQLIRLISEMKNCPDFRSIEESALMLRNFLRFPVFHAMVKPFMKTLLETIPLHADVRTTTAGLAALGELCIVSRGDILPYSDQLLPVIIANVLDTTSFNKQEIAVKTLGQFVGSTGLVVRPYLLYPQLLPTALDMLFKSTANRPQTLRLELLRTLGLTGALDPNRFDKLYAYIERSKKTTIKELLEDASQDTATNENEVVVPNFTALEQQTLSDRDRNMTDFVATKGAIKLNIVPEARDRADSSVSGTDRASIYSKRDRVNSGTSINTNVVNAVQTANSNAKAIATGNTDRSDLIRSDVFLGDNADAPAHLFMYEQSVMRSLSQPKSTELTRYTPSSAEFYPRVAISSLVKVLKDNSLAVHHSAVTQTIIQIFRSLGSKCVPFLEQILPYFLQLVRRSNHGLRESILQQLSQLVTITPQSITPYLPAILDILKDYWDAHLEYVLSIVQHIAVNTAESFGSYFTQLLPLLLSSLTIPSNLSVDEYRLDPTAMKPLEQTLHCFRVLRAMLRSHIQLVIPALCKLLTHLQNFSSDTLYWQTQTVHTIKIICNDSKGALVEHSNVIISITIQALISTILTASALCAPPSNDIFHECVGTLCVLAYHIGPKILPFDNSILQVIEGRGFETMTYRDLSTAIRNGSWYEMTYLERDDPWSLPHASGSSGAIHAVLPDMDGPDTHYHETELMRISGTVLSGQYNARVAGNFQMNTLSNAIYLHDMDDDLPLLGSEPIELIDAHVLNPQNLARAWDVSQRSTAADWHEWLKRFNIELLRESPNPTLRVCAGLAQAHAPVAKDLFHAAFVSCWHQLSESYKMNLVRSLQTAFSSATIPPEILQSLLNLAEFMEHDVEALPIGLTILAELAQKGHAYAKALHYRELEFQLYFKEPKELRSPTACFDSLININKKLGQYDAASGLLKLVKQVQRKHPELIDVYTIKEAWLAKLGHWEEALEKYNAKLVRTPDDSVSITGKLKCLDALGRWEEAVGLCQQKLDLLRVESEQIGMNSVTDSTAMTGGANTIENTTSSIKYSLHAKAAVIGARAAWSLSDWNTMDSFVSHLQDDTIDSSFMKAVLAVHTERYEEAAINTEKTRQKLDRSISALLTESYSRAYMPFTMVQQCSELEEIIEFKRLLKAAGITAENQSISNQFEYGGQLNYPPSTSEDGLIIRPNPNSTDIPRGPFKRESLASLFEADGRSSADDAATASHILSLRESQQQELKIRKQALTEKWRRRIRGCFSSGRAAIPVWRSLLNGRRMVLTEKEDLDTWLDFVSLCRNSGNNALAERVLSMSQHAALSLSPAVSKMKLEGDVPTDGQPLSLNMYSNSSDARSMNNLFFSQSPIGAVAKNGFPFGTAVDEQAIVMDRRIRFAMLKQRWAVGDRNNALNGLERLLEEIGSLDDVKQSNNPTNSTSFLSCLLKLGEWRIAMTDPAVAVEPEIRWKVLELYSKATELDPSNYRAWHHWGLCNFRAIEDIRGLKGAHSSTSLPGKVKRVSLGSVTGLGGGQNAERVQKVSLKDSLYSAYRQADSNQRYVDHLIPIVVDAINGMMRALTLGTRRWSSSVAQDMLCILSLWFRYCKIPEVHAALEAGLVAVHLDNWLGVLPQLIARIDHPDKDTRNLLHNLLIRLGVKHPQAMVYPLSVALKNPKGRRKDAAESLMASLRQHSTKLVEQALLVSHELVRVAILWEESWHWGLEEASRQYFGDGNVQGMLDIVVPLHQLLETGPNTLRETSFTQAYGGDLNDAWEKLQKYMNIIIASGGMIPTSGANRRSNDPNLQKPEDTLLHQVWDSYFAVFKSINAQLPHLTALDLQSCSPSLLNSQHLDIGVPGTYSVSGSAVRISSFGRTVAIIRSKQRPRKIRIFGENGQEFVFLLKGHEDLRQDERAMQLFGLVNALLYNDRRTGPDSTDFSIQRYAVMPLSPTAGLISWVPKCDTLHDLIKQHRDSKKIMLDVEHKLILQVAPNKLYDLLPSIHKLELFEHALKYTTGEDLAKILWLKSENSESWLQRRATYTRSLAVMSMVGYILGLGDRHPSNLMLDRDTGKVLHIDFGDCFEVAMHRDKYPEKVPFRLTRMLVNAMEIAGIEGNYRSTCEKVMTVLRENRESLIATLEAFLHDPLISWRLLNINKNKVEPTKSTEEMTPTNNENAQQSSKTPADTSNSESSINTVSTKSPADPRTLNASPTSTGSNDSGNNSAQLNATVERRPRAYSKQLPKLATVQERRNIEKDTNQEETEDEDDEGCKSDPDLAPVLATAATTAIEDKPVVCDFISIASTSSGVAGGSEGNRSNSATGKSVSFSMRDELLVMRGNRDDTDQPPLLNTSVAHSGNFRPNLHIEMTNLANSLSRQSPNRASYSLARNEVGSISVASLMHSEGASYLHSMVSGGSSVYKPHPALSQSLASKGSLNMDGAVDADLEDEVMNPIQRELTDKAMIVIRRVMDKLTGLDFVAVDGATIDRTSTPSHGPTSPNRSRQAQALEVPDQVDRLIREASANENLSLSFFGWCPFW